MAKAYIIGNGTTRSDFDLETLRGKGTIYGCNGLYRDFLPDVLVCTDPEISKTIQETDYEGNIITNWPIEGRERVEKIGARVERNDRPANRKMMRRGRRTALGQYYWYIGFCSGATASVYACLDGHDEVYFIGMDFKGLDGKQNNIYSGTDHYKAANEDEAGWRLWVEQFEKLIKQNKNVTFYHVSPLDGFTPPELLELDNVKIINSLDEL